MSPSILKRDEQPDIAYYKTEGNSPCVIFLGGFRSDMSGTKATALEKYCRSKGQAFIRFDYSGHGMSEGSFEKGTIGQWFSDALAIIDKVSEGPLVLVGSSMGGWISLLAAQHRPDRVKAFIGLAAAPDFTEMIYKINREQCDREFAQKGWFSLPSGHPSGPYVITRTLIEESREHLLMGKKIHYNMPIILIQGMKDISFPWQEALKVRRSIGDSSARVLFIPEADHRLSRPKDLEHICGQVKRMCELVKSSGMTLKQAGPPGYEVTA